MSRMIKTDLAKVYDFERRMNNVMRNIQFGLFITLCIFLIPDQTGLTKTIFASLAMITIYACISWMNRKFNNHLNQMNEEENHERFQMALELKFVSNLVVAAVYVLSIILHELFVHTSIS